MTPERSEGVMRVPSVAAPASGVMLASPIGTPASTLSPASAMGAPSLGGPVSAPLGSPVPASSTSAAVPAPRVPPPGGNAHGHASHTTVLHLPHGSWWPFWVANGIFLFGLAAILFGHNIPKEPDNSLILSETPLWVYPVLLVGALALVGALIGWFRQDYLWWNQKLGTGEHIPKAGALLFVSSEVFLFGALFATYFTFKALNPTWPDPNEHGHAVYLPLVKTGIFTLFLFASSWTCHQADKRLAVNDKRGFNNWWLLTIVLGLIFLAGQVNEYITLINEGHTLGSSAFMTAFFMLTGTHGLHVFGGLVFLVIVYIRSRKGQFDSERHAAPQTASLYWHFVDIIWVIVFSVIYLGNM